MPPKRPTSVLVIAILHFVFGGIALAFGLCGGAFQVAGGNQAFQPAGVGGQQAKEQQQLQEDLQKALEEKVPAGKAVQYGNLGVDLLLSAMMIVSAIGLLKVLSWGRSLSIVYAVLSIIHKVFAAVYAFAFTIPATNEVVEKFLAKQNLGEQGRMLGRIVEITAIGAVIFALLTAIYPIIVLIVMFRPKVVAAFRGETLGPAMADYDDRYPQGRLAPPDERFESGGR